MNSFRGLCLSMSLVAAAGSAQAAGVTIGIVAPQQGPYAVLGAQIFAGAGFQIKESQNTIVTINEPCDEGSGQAVAEALVNAKVQVAIGFLCTETLEGALPRLKDANVPAITLSVRSHTLMQDALKNGWPLFRLAPQDGAEAEKLTDFILKQWAGQPIALIEDGTIHGRELTEAIRNALEEKGLKPVFTDTYRPGQEQQIALVRRLKKAGANHVFVGGDRSDLAVIARDAASDNIPLTLLGGDALRAADQPVPLANGVLGAVVPEYSLLPPGAAVAKALQAANTVAEGYVLPAYAAAAIGAQSVADAVAQKKSTAELLGATTFQTVLGPVAFKNQELSANPYQILQWRDGAFRPSTPPTN